MPIQLDDTLLFNASPFQMCTDSERSDKVSYAIFELQDRLIVEVVIVIMRDDKIIQIGKIFRLIACTCAKCTISSRHRSRGKQSGINRKLLSSDLKIICGMSKPNQEILCRIELVQIGFGGWDRLAGAGYRFFSEEKVCQSLSESAFLVRHHFGGSQILKLSITIVWRIEDSLEPFSACWRSKQGVLQVGSHANDHN